MAKCIICGKKAEFKIKGVNECYCEECAEENFGELDLLEKMGEEGQAGKKAGETDGEED